MFKITQLFAKRGAIVLLVVMSLVACSKKIMDPLYERVPAIPEVPEYKLLDPLSVPGDKQLQLNKCMKFLLFIFIHNYIII